MEDSGQSIHDFKRSKKYDQIGKSSRVSIERDIACQDPMMFASLFSAGFLQCSAKWQNVTIKRGPLSVPVGQRSYKTPSLRLIDLGRACVRCGCSHSNLLAL